MFLVEMGEQITLKYKISDNEIISGGITCILKVQIVQISSKLIFEFSINEGTTFQIYKKSPIRGKKPKSIN